MNHLAAILLVDDDTVQHDEGLRVALQRVHAADVHVVAHGQGTAACHRVDVGSQLVAHLRRDVTGSGELRRARPHAVQHIVVGAIQGTGSVALHHYLAQLARLVQAHANHIVTGDGDRDGAAVEGNLHLERTVLLGQGRIAFAGNGLHQHTDQRFVGSLADDTSLYGACRLLLLRLANLNHRRILLHGFLFLLGEEAQGRNHQEG